MFQALKKLTRRVLKGFGTLLPLLLATPAMAQWGAVTTKQDTSRFINGAFNNGLIMPHQQVIVGLLDTTITSVAKGGGNAAEIIVGSLLDYKDNCVNYSIVNGVASCAGSYERWRELEKSTSWYQAARGDTTAMFPTNYAVTISTGSDSVKVWNRDTAESWMVFLNGSNFMINKPGSETISGITFKDGTLRVSSSGGTGGVNVIDFLDEKNSGLFYTSTGGPYVGTIQERNTAKGYTLGGWETALVLLNRNVNAIDAVRDPFGLKDALGRPEHWWAGSSPSNGGGSLYNPHTNTIVDQAASSGDFNNISLSDRGQIWMTYNNSGANDNLSMIGNVLFGQAADGWTPYVNYTPTGSGAQDLGWTSANNGVRILASNNRNSIVGENADNAYAWCDEGVYIISPMGGFGVAAKQARSARQRLSATVNAPVEFGDGFLAISFNTGAPVDNSPYATSITENGSPGTITGVFSHAYSSRYGSYLSAVDSDNVLGTGSWYFSFWLKAPTQYGSGDTNIMGVITTGGTPTTRAEVHFDAAGNVNAYRTDDNGVAADLLWSSSPVLTDNEWHHIVFLYDKGSNPHLRLYADGRMIDSSSGTAAANSLTGTEFKLGVGPISGVKSFRGLISDISIGKTYISDQTIAEIHAEGRKKLALGNAFPSPVFSMATSHNGLISNNVADIDALDNGIWGVVFSDAATAQIFDGRIPIQEIAAPAGTVKSIALIQNPGADSVGVAIGTTTNLKFVQPAVNLRAAMEHQYKEPIFVGQKVMVDSAGIDGTFWTGDDGIDAGFNAGRTFIKIARGTYTPFDVDHPGMIIEGSGWSNVVSATDHTYGGTIIDGTGIGDAIDVASGPHSIVRDLAVFTEGGLDNTYAGIHVTSSYVTIDNIIAIDSDHYPIELASTYTTVMNSRFYDADGWSVAAVGGCCNTIIGNHFVDCGNAIYLAASSDDNIAVGNHHKDCGLFFQTDSGANYNIFVGNRYDGSYTNNGTGTVITGNDGTAH